MAFSGKNLRLIRTSRNWTLDDVSRLSGVNKGYLSNLENEIQANPGLEIVEKLAQVFEVRLDYFSSKTEVLSEHVPGLPRGLWEFMKKQEKSRKPVNKKALKFLKGIVERSPANWSAREWEMVYKSYVQDEKGGKGRGGK